MNINKYLATFQLVGNRISELNITNEFVNLIDSKNIKVSYDVEYEIGNINKEGDEYFGILILHIKISTKLTEDRKIKAKSKFELTIEGCFSGSADMQADEFNNMLKLNGSASLYSIARGFVISVSSQVFSGGKIVLPLINFNQMHEVEK